MLVLIFLLVYLHYQSLQFVKHYLTLPGKQKSLHTTSKLNQLIFHDWTIYSFPFYKRN